MRLMKTRIVIAGGGFAGVYAAMYLDKTLARSRDVEVVLISRDNWIHVWYQQSPRRALNRICQ